MSGRGHRGKRPRGDGSRGPRTSSCSRQPHYHQVSLLCGPMLCTPAMRRLVFSVLLLRCSLWHLHILPILWRLVPRLLSIALCGALTLFGVLHLPSTSFLLQWLVRLMPLLHHPAVAIVMAVQLLVRCCSAAPTPTPIDEPPHTPLPPPDPVPAPSLELESATISSFSVGPSTFIIVTVVIVLLSLATLAIAHARSRARRRASAPCGLPCCASPFPPPRRRRPPHLHSRMCAAQGAQVL